MAAGEISPRSPDIQLDRLNADVNTFLLRGSESFGQIAIGASRSAFDKKTGAEKRGQA
jgi:hypothetical protein